jgi:hypothetical protein
MNERGWGWTASEIRRAQLVEWIVPQSGVEYVPVGPFYKALRTRERTLSRWYTAISRSLNAAL